MDTRSHHLIDPPPDGKPGATERESAREAAAETRALQRFAVGVLITIAILASVLVLWIAHFVVLTLFLGVLFGLPVADATRWLTRWKIPRLIGSFLIVGGAIALIVGFVRWNAPTLREQSHELRLRMPEAMDKLDVWLGHHAGGILGIVFASSDSASVRIASGRQSGTHPPADTAARDKGASSADTTAAGSAAGGAVGAASAHDSSAAAGSELRHQMAGELRNFRHSIMRVVTSTVSVVTGVLLVVFMAVYIGAEPEVYHRWLMQFVPTRRRARATEYFDAVGVTLRRWLVAQLLAMAITGLIVTGFLVVLGIKGAYPLGILTGLARFVPIVGPIAAALPAMAMGFLVSPHTMLVVAVGLVLLSVLENHLIIPVVMHHGVDLPPALTLAVQAVMAVLFGIIGLLVAVPLLAAILAVVRTAQGGKD